ncbi:MAG: VTT domain-containing protein [Bosea sp. (in: a-proteobacteria)]
MPRLLQGFRSDAVSYLLFLRLAPVFPFWLVNLAAALGGVGLPVFLWTTLVGIVPGTLALAFAGRGLDSAIAAQGAARASCLAAGVADCARGLTLSALMTPELLAGLGLLGCVALIPIVWRRISKRRSSGQGERM